MSDPTTTPAAPPAGGPPPAEPWLARAARILAGDVRPDDYLPVTPKVAEAVAVELAFARTRRGPVAPEVEGRQFRQALLCYHHGGQDVLTYDTDRGVIVLAVGEAIRDVLAAVPDDAAARVCVETPDVW